MTRVLFAVSGSDHWTLNDGTKHPCGYWPEELVVPHKIFRDAGFDITVATPGAVPPTADEAGFAAAANGGSEEPGRRFRAYLETISASLGAPLDLDAADAAEYDLVFVPGGHGPMEDLATSARFGALIGAFTAAGKPVSAVCHGPAAFLPARDAAGGWLFAGRAVTGFSNEEEAAMGFAARAPWLLEDRLGTSGGRYERAGAFEAHVVSDGNLHTGQNPASSAPLAERLVRLSVQGLSFSPAAASRVPRR
ncbi:type 1 glutamine amidotransferase domain-containing protein [Streptomyces sp. NPDC093018]|uniref:type 1 glutamine amidotransferase domain-containing protein n=1 Tax=Streptomyces sp. NPDC093018 TaxID=3155067 RepID=UPI0034339FB1